MAIDLSRLPAPDAIEPLNFEGLNSEFIAAFKSFWAVARSNNPSLPDYDVELLETDPAIVLGEAFSSIRLNDRARINEAVRSVLAPFATGSNLDAIAASQGLIRPIISPANPITGAPALYMRDDQFRQMYLESFDRASAGSSDLYKFVVRRAWPLVGDIMVNGWAVHRRRGDTDVVIMGPEGRVATEEEWKTVSSAVHDPSVYPEAVSVAVIRSSPRPYTVDLLVEVPSGPDAGILHDDILNRVMASARERTLIGGEIPPALFSGAAYGPNVVSVFDRNPVIMAQDRYAHPLCVGVNIDLKVRS